MDKPSGLARLTRRDMLRWLSASGAGLGLSACGGGGDTSSGGDPTDTGGGTTPAAGDPAQAFSRAGAGTPGTPVTAAQREAAFGALEARLAELWDFSTGRASASAVLDWLQARPEFQRVGYSSTRDVYAVFTDGRPLIVATRWRSDRQGVKAAPQQLRERSAQARRNQIQRLSATRTAQRATAAAATGAITDYDAGIPSRRMRYMNTWFPYGPDWPADTWARGTGSSPAGVASMEDPGTVAFRMWEFGYERVAFDSSDLDTAPTVEGLKSVSGDGVFYWMTHGGTLDLDGQIVQGLMTGTPATQNAVEDVYADEFADGTLIYYTGPLCLDTLQCNVHPGQDGTTYTRLAITPKWIGKYGWSFGKYSLVFVNACASATGAMKQAFLDAGASLFLGWTAPVRAWAMCGATMDVFSLLMGFNENAGSSFDDVPRQRPYDWGAVFDLLNTQGGSQAVAYWDDEDGYVELEPTLNAGVPVGFLGLRPSIFQTSFDEERSQFSLIGGMFGTDGGTAAVGTDQHCPSGAALCSTFANAADYVLSDPVAVEVVDWKPENVVLKLPTDGPGSQGLVQVTVDGRWSNLVQLTRITVPVTGSYRDGGGLQVTMHGELSFRCDLRGIRLEPTESLRYPIVPFMSAVQAFFDYQAGGAYTYDEGDASVTVEWSGSGRAQNRSSAGEVAMLAGVMYPQTRGGDFVATFVVQITEKITVRHPDRPDDVTQTQRSITIGTAPMADVTNWPIHASFDAGYAGAAVHYQYVQEAVGHNQMNTLTTLDVGPFSSQFPPSDELGGR